MKGKYLLLVITMMIRPYLHNAKYYETDQMGIIHHSNYIRWFEEARIDYMNQIGLTYKKMEEADCTENVDKAYLFQMIASHKATNKLAEQFVQYSSNITVQEIATKMIERQTKELKQMEKFVREIR